MAYPTEDKHVRYLKYVEDVSLGDRPGPQMTKDEWRKTQERQDIRAKQLKSDRDQRDPNAPSIYRSEY